jgi:hypothetical protein
MKEVLLHIGYPKTATSTLQNNLFYELHLDGKINFLGRSKRGNKVFNPSEKLVQEAMFGNPIPTGQALHLSEDLLNIISNEDISFSFYNIDGARYLKPCDPFVTAERLYTYFASEDCKVKILITLRSQDSLIPSYYVEGFRWHFRYEESLDTFDKFVNQGLAHKMNGMFRMFYFFEIIEKYADLFGKENITILMYEDITHDIDSFSSKLSEAIGCNESSVSETFAVNFDNKKIKTDGGSFTDKITLNQYLVDIVKKRVSEEQFTRLKNILLKIGGQPIKGLLESISHIQVGGSEFVRKPDQDTLRLIRNEFRIGNMALAERYNIDIDKMSKYGYI